MAGVKKTISPVMVALAVASVVHADMMPMSPPEGGVRWSVFVCGRTVCQPSSDSHGSLTFQGTVDLDLLPVGFLPEVKSQVGDIGSTKPAPILTDRQNSLTLCLYALFGLGLCRSAPFVKKLHFRCIPDWYHSGGPAQIGHSFAISPDCRISTPVFCFIQPAGERENVALQYFSGTIAALLSKSQFTPTSLASRGPPRMS